MPIWRKRGKGSSRGTAVCCVSYHRLHYFWWVTAHTAGQLLFHILVFDIICSPSFNSIVHAFLLEQILGLCLFGEHPCLSKPNRHDAPGARSSTNQARNPRASVGWIWIWIWIALWVWLT